MLGFFRKKQDLIRSESLADEVRKALQQVVLPEGVDIVSSGIVTSITGAEGGKISVVMEIDPARADSMEGIRLQAEQILRRNVAGGQVTVVMTARKEPANGGVSAVREPQGAGARAKMSLPHIKKIIAVASGKGGVGKSTTAVNVAVALAGRGLSVGLLDADIYGPSIPMMLGLSGKPLLDDKKRMIPPEKYGLQAMSIGLLMDDEAPLVWRGPMVHAAIQQLFRDVAWGDLDVVVVDMPPGTGDAQLTLAQTIPLSGVVIVSTPQDISLIDARKGLAMFQKVNVPVLGIIENMSYFSCPHCGGRSDIFHHGGAEAEAQRLGVPFLGAMPLDIQVREHADRGEPIALQGDCPAGQAYKAIAAKLWALLD